MLLYYIVAGKKRSTNNSKVRGDYFTRGCYFWGKLNLVNAGYALPE